MNIKDKELENIINDFLKKSLYYNDTYKNSKSIYDRPCCELRPYIYSLGDKADDICIKLDIKIDSDNEEDLEDFIELINLINNSKLIKRLRSNLAIKDILE
jgi:hypothetical protein